MHVHFVKNIQFSKVIKTDGRMREFNFRKPNGQDEGLFTVDVSDDRGNRIVFKMQKEDQTWKIVPQQLPAWILENESVLQEAIDEGMKNA
jgi:hypothetical protein